MFDSDAKLYVMSGLSYWLENFMDNCALVLVWLFEAVGWIITGSDKSKPSPEPMMACCQVDPREQISMKTK